MPSRDRHASPLTNIEIARALRELGLHLDMDGVSFKPRAYEKAAQTVAAAPTPLRDLYRQGGCTALQSLPGIGSHLAAKIESLLQTGVIEELESLRQKRPIDILELVEIEGFGPRSARRLYETLGIRTVDELEAAARAGRLRTAPRFGPRSEQKILRGIEFLHQSRGRQPIGRVLGLAREIEARLCKLPSVTHAAAAGSIRRYKETIGDLDFVVASAQPQRVIEYFIGLPEVMHVHAKGDTKALVRFAIGIDADLRVVPPESFGAALAYFTGNKQHNVALRRIALEKGMKLNEYGLFRGKRKIAGRTEEEIYAALGLPFIPPELREDNGEVEAARQARLPRLIEARDLRGDLQVHTRWTDGADSLEDMVEAAQELGLEYLAITDHTRGLAMTGMTPERLIEQAEAVRRLDRTLASVRVMAGAEVNIRRDGTLDTADEVMAQLDIVGAAVHSHFGLARHEMTQRLIRAMENPHVDILFHPTARNLPRRPPVDIDIDAVIAAALRTGTALEIDAQPDRLDLGADLARRAAEAGVMLVIDSDAHSRSELRFAREFGIPTARRAWVERSRVLNALPFSSFLAWLGASGARRPSRKRAVGS